MRPLLKEILEYELIFRELLQKIYIIKGLGWTIIKE